MRNRIKEIAKERNIKLEVLAQKTGLSKTTIYSISRGSSMPTIENAYKVAKVLNVRIEELFFNE